MKFFFCCRDTSEKGKEKPEPFNGACFGFSFFSDNSVQLENGNDFRHIAYC
jgi:ATP-dependent phosphoenolpyruvate carboxykinase